MRLVNVQMTYQDRNCPEAVRQAWPLLLPALLDVTSLLHWPVLEKEYLTNDIQRSFLRMFSFARVVNAPMGPPRQEMATNGYSVYVQILFMTILAMQ